MFEITGVKNKELVKRDFEVNENQQCIKKVKTIILGFGPVDILSSKNKLMKAYS